MQAGKSLVSFDFTEPWVVTWWGIHCSVPPGHIADPNQEENFQFLRCRGESYGCRGHRDSGCMSMRCVCNGSVDGTVKITIISVPNQMGFPCGSVGKPTCSMGDLGSIPGLGRSPGEENDYPLQYSGLENSTDCIVHGVAELDTTEWLSLYSQSGMLWETTSYNLQLTTSPSWSRTQNKS